MARRVQHLAGALAAGAVVGSWLAGCGAASSPPTAARAPARIGSPSAVASTSRFGSPSVVASPRSATSQPPLGGASEIRHGSRAHRLVALTFDADMTRGMLAMLRSGRQRTWYDAGIVRELRATRTPATVFLTGLWTQTYPREVRRLARSPLFELENHSVDHAGWLAPCYGLPVVAGELSKRAEIAGAAAAIRRVAGVTPRYFRFPGGCHDASDLRLVRAAGERAVGWDVVSGDPFQPDPAVVVRNVERAVRPGSIVVMHLIGAPNAPATERALPTVIAELRSRGYRFVTLHELLAHR